MIPLPLFLEIRKAAICHCQSIWCCNWCGTRKVNEITSVYVANEIKFSFVHFSTGIQYTFYRSVHLVLSYGAKQDQKWCVVLSILKRSARLSSIITVFFQASKLMPACSPCWSFVSLYRGFKFQLCAIVVSVCSKTSRDASKDHYLAFLSEKRRCCVEIRNVRYWYFDASQKFENFVCPTDQSFWT
jgi:hypothetical protein